MPRIVCSNKKRHCDTCRLSFIADGRICNRKAIVTKHIFKAKILVNLRPMDTVIGKIEVATLGIGGIKQTRPSGELVTRPQTVLGLGIYGVFVHPNA